jgi:hypothetical protein
MRQHATFCTAPKSRRRNPIIGAPHPWHSPAGAGAIHSIDSRHALSPPRRPRSLLNKKNAREITPSDFLRVPRNSGSQRAFQPRHPRDVSDRSRNRCAVPGRQFKPLQKAPAAFAQDVMEPLKAGWLCSLAFNRRFPTNHRMKETIPHRRITSVRNFEPASGV